MKSFSQNNSFSWKPSNFKDCLLQILLGPLLNTLSQLFVFLIIRLVAYLTEPLSMKPWSLEMFHETFVVLVLCKTTDYLRLSQKNILISVFTRYRITSVSPSFWFVFEKYMKYFKVLNAIILYFFLIYRWNSYFRSRHVTWWLSLQSFTR